MPDLKLVPIDHNPFEVWGNVGAAMPEAYGADSPIMDPVAKAALALGNAAYSGAAAPGDAMSGKLRVMDDEGRPTPEAIARSMDIAGMTTLGAGAIPAEANSLRMGIKAYHGSPHDFDKFSMDKIGTGEGAQAYGHGLYFAENESVAKAYRDQLSAEHTIKGEPVSEAAKVYDAYNEVSEPKIAAYIHSYGDVPSARAALISEGDKKTAKLMDAMHARGDIKPGGRVYQVDINADPGHFLDYDKALPSDHPVRSKLKELAQFGLDAHEGGVDRQLAKDAFVHADNPNLTGEGAYRQMTNAIEAARPKLKEMGNPKALFGGTAPLANEELVKAGIPGIKYLDQGSRGAGEGSRNYVVFDDNIVNIVRKYGLAGLSMLPPATAAYLSQKIQPVDHDPFAPASALTPVDHDPFIEQRS